MGCGRSRNPASPILVRQRDPVVYEFMRFTNAWLLLLIPLLPLLWIAAFVTMGRLSGWARLSEFYHFSGDFTGRQWRGQHSLLRWGLGHKGFLNLGVSNDGLYLAVPPLMRIGQAPLFIPWDDISKGERSDWGNKYVEFRFARAPSIPFCIRLALADEIGTELGDRWRSLPSVSVSTSRAV